jgi:hypothetical protein
MSTKITIKLDTLNADQLAMLAAIFYADGVHTSPTAALDVYTALVSNVGVETALDLFTAAKDVMARDLTAA